MVNLSLLVGPRIGCEIVARISRDYLCESDRPRSDRSTHSYVNDDKDDDPDESGQADDCLRSKNMLTIQDPCRAGGLDLKSSFEALLDS